jgi:hypothetical protein
MILRRPHPRPNSSRRRRLIPLLLVTTLLGLQAALATPAAAQSFSDCAQPPALERPGEGMVGSIDPPQGNGYANSLYSQYGYAGLVWHTYDQQTGPACGDPFAEFTTWVSNRVFDVAKLIVGSVNALHYMIYDGGGVLGLDDLVKHGSAALYNGVAIPYIAFALLLVAVVIFAFAAKGDLAKVSKATGRVVIGLWIMAATALTPLLYTTITDSLLVDGVKELEANVYQQTIKGDVVYRDVLPEMLHKTVIEDNWAIGEFGSTDGDFVTKTTPELLDAQAWTRNDLVTGRDANDTAEQQKHDKFKRIAEQVKQHANYDAFTGDGSSRIGASAFALAEAVCFGLFQLVCKLAILLAQVVFRFAILVGPILGLLAFASGVIRTVARAVLGMLAQGIILTAAALTHAMIMNWIIDAGTFGRFAKLLLMALVTILAWKALRPWHRLKGMAAAAVGVTMPSRHEQRLEDLLRRHNRNSKGNWFTRAFRKTSTAPHWGHGKGIPQHPPWPPREPAPRPETHDGQELRDIVVHPSRQYDPGFDYIDGEWWESTTPEPSRRAELAQARAGLPPGTGRRTEGSGDGRGRRSGTGGGNGGGGAAARAEGTEPESGWVRPSEVEERNRWLDAEHGEAGDVRVADESKSEDDKPVITVYVPSTGRVEPNTEGAAEPRPESEGDS